MRFTNYDYLYDEVSIEKESLASDFCDHSHFTLVTHTDADGLGCRLMITTEYKSLVTKVIHVDYMDADKIIKESIDNDSFPNNRVLFTDFSVSQKSIDLLEAAGIDWFCIDHHRDTQAIAEKYPNNVWLETGICATEQCWLLGRDEELRTVASLIGIGDVFRVDDPNFFTAREITVGIKSVSDHIYHLVNKQELNEITYLAFINAVSYEGNLESPMNLEHKFYTSRHFAILEFISDKTGREPRRDSLAMIILELETLVAVEQGVRLGTVLYVDARFGSNFSTLAHMIFTKYHDIRYVVKIGESGSISARGSKVQDNNDVSYLNNGEFCVKGHKLAAGGQHDLLKTKKGNKEELEEAAKKFKFITHV